MKCQGKFKYKGIEKKDAGEFVDKNGVLIKYDAKYVIKVDEICNNVVCDTFFKVPIESPIIPILSAKEIYSDLVLELEIQFFKNGTFKITPINVIK